MKHLKDKIQSSVNYIVEEIDGLSFPYNVSEWKRIGIERNYWDYFKTEVINEYLLEAKNAVKVK